MARRGKFARLVEDFVATVDELGGRADPTMVAAELQARIDAIAAQLHVTTQTVLRTYIDEVMLTGLRRGFSRVAVARC